MPSFQLSYFVGPRLLATTTLDSAFAPHSMAYFCHSCGDLWGRVLVSAEGHTPYWHVEHTPCQKHQRTGVPDWHSHIPGSFLSEQDSRKSLLSCLKWARAIEHLPAAVLQWELDRHIDYLEKQNVY